MNTKVFSFKWKEGNFKRVYQSFDFAEGFKKVLSFMNEATKDGLQVSGASCSVNSYCEAKRNISLQCI
jgi:hypothetical protein